MSLDKVFIFDNKLMIRSRFERGVWKDKQVVTKPAKHTYNRYFSFYKQPRKVIKNLISIQRKFLWQRVSEENKICWVSYKMFLPKSKGGLRVKHLQPFNYILLSKWRRRLIIDTSATWRCLLNHRYGWCNTPFLSLPNDASLWWRDLVSLDPLTNGPCTSLVPSFHRKENYLLFD